MKGKENMSFGFSEHVGKIAAAKFKESWATWPEGAGVLALGALVGAVEGALKGVGTTLVAAARGNK